MVHVSDNAVAIMIRATAHQVAIPQYNAIIAIQKEAVSWCCDGVFAVRPFVDMYFVLIYVVCLVYRHVCSDEICSPLLEFFVINIGVMV